MGYIKDQKEILDAKEEIILEKSLSRGTSLELLVEQGKAFYLIGAGVSTSADGVISARLISAGRLRDTLHVGIVPDAGGQPSAQFNLTMDRLVGDGERKYEIRANGRCEASLVGYIQDIAPHKPSRVQNVSAQGARESVLLTWAESQDNGGSPTVGVQIEQATIDPQDGGSFDVIINNTNNRNLRFTVGVLEDNTPYWYRITPIHPILGLSDEKATIVMAVTSIDTPLPPSRPRLVTRLDTTITINWIPNSDDGGSPITRYLIETSEDGIIYRTAGMTRDSTPTFILEGLEAYTDYYIRVSTSNEAHTSLPSSVAVIRTKSRSPSRPRNLSITSDRWNRATLSWEEPQDNGGREIINYTIERHDDFGLQRTFVTDGAVLTFTDVIDTATRGKTVFRYRVFANNPDSQSRYAHHFVVTRSHVTSIPQNVTAIAKSSTVIEVTWEEPTELNNTTIAEYQAFTFIKTLTGGNGRRYRIPSDAEFKYQITGLNPEQEYQITMAVQNTDGFLSHKSSAILVRTPESPFGKSTETLTVPANSIVRLGENKDYADIILNENSVLEITDNIVVRAKNYSQHASAEIRSLPSGCSGGLAGVSAVGRRGESAYYSIRGNIRDGTPPRLPIFQSGGLAIPCNTESQFEALLQHFENQIEFDRLFGALMGTRGSDGTDPVPSGMGGAGGISGFSTNTRFNKALPRDGGDGGLGAAGVSGVLGGGVLGLFIQNINSIIKINGKGMTGNNGNQGNALIIPIGTGSSLGLAAGRPASSPTDSCNSGEGGNQNRPCEFGMDGANASEAGTLGSKGGQGSVFYLYYKNYTPTDSSVNDDLNVDGGDGGYHGADANADDELLETRADSGAIGFKYVEQLV